MELREKVAFYLEDIDTPIGRGINLFITGLVLASSAIFVVETYNIPASLETQLDVFGNAILLIFVIEYLLRLWCAKDRIHHIFSLFSIVDLVTILPFLFGADIGFFRIFRWFRILRLIRFIGGKTIFGYVSSEDSAIVTRILFTLISIIFVYSGLIYQVEHASNPKYDTFLDAIYFSVSTITTAGFGDITPNSQLGKLLTALMLLTGVVLIPWQLGDLIKRFVKTSDQVSIVCSGCGLALHDSDAQFCKVCGTALKHS
ncbi:ion transporter [Myxacorys almedinensis]|uniref:Ion transporter n=1 Tax=Myxacorys almedinensis A TaxID=2690445 RepID=A0A8J7YXI8_9CYAN|nr:ion transporter [Myxacorys almedinensis]NDJ15984.1 ion transporter [Myxacorys almedinensis A]